MTEQFKEKVYMGAQQLGIELNETQLGRLETYCDMLFEKNKVMNLTSVTEEDEVITKHLIDSLSLVQCIQLSIYSADMQIDSDDIILHRQDEKTEAAKKTGKCNAVVRQENASERRPEEISMLPRKAYERGIRMIDVGTGAGLPGMVLKIAFPDLDVTLFDSLKKRLIFLDEVIAELGLTNIRTVHGRAEDFGRTKEAREQFDLVVSRAVANMASLSEYCLPFVRKNGLFAAYKSADSHGEIESALGAIGKLGGELESEKLFMLPDSEIERRIAIIRKVRNTPAAYPRKAGTPAKNPLQ